MKQTSIYKIALLVLAGVLTFTSCEKDEITSISFDKASLDINVGLSDTLTCTIQYTGDIAEFPIEWLTDKSGIFEFTEINDDDDNDESASSKHTLTKKVIVKALKAGTSSITISTGGKTHSCTVTVSQQTFTFTGSLTGYWGDWYDIDLNAFDMYLMENSFHINNEGKIEGTGHILYLDFNLPLNITNRLSTGEYFIYEDPQPQGFEPGEVIEHEDKDDFSIVGSHLMEIVSKEKILISLVTGGYYEVERQGDIYFIEGTLQLHTDEVIRFTYEGEVTIEDNKPKAEILESILAEGEFIYYGDYYGEGIANNIELYLYNATELKEDSVVIDDLLKIELNSNLSAKDSIPSGTYEITKNYQPFTLVPGFISKNNLGGSWYLSDSIHSYKPYVGGDGALKIKSGDMKVSKADSVYTIVYNFRNRFGSEVSGTFIGVLGYTDATKQQPENIQTGNQAKIKGLNASNSFKLPVHKLQQQRLSPIDQRIKHHNLHSLRQAGRLPENVEVVLRRP